MWDAAVPWSPPRSKGWVSEQFSRRVKREASIHWLLTPLGQGRYPWCPGWTMHVCPLGSHRHLKCQHKISLGQEVRGCSTLHFEMKHCQCKLGQNLCRKDHSDRRGGPERMWGKVEEMSGTGLKGCLLVPAAWVSGIIPTMPSPRLNGPAFLSVLQVMPWLSSESLLGSH